MNLKQIKRGPDRKFAYLIEPSTQATNDQELYHDILLNGRAVIREIKLDLSLGPITELTPAEFAETWQGD